MNIVNDTVTRYWATTVLLLAGTLAGYGYCLPAVVGLNIIQVFHFIHRTKSLTAFPVQVRVAYLGLLILSQAPYMIWILWWQLIGTSAMVLYRYCFLARCLSLLPWNRREAYSWQLVKRTFFTPPVTGSILEAAPVRPPA